MAQKLRNSSNTKCPWSWRRKKHMPTRFTAEPVRRCMFHRPRITARYSMAWLSSALEGIHLRACHFVVWEPTRISRIPSYCMTKRLGSGWWNRHDVYGWKNTGQHTHKKKRKKQESPLKGIFPAWKAMDRALEKLYPAPETGTHAKMERLLLTGEMRTQEKATKHVRPVERERFRIWAEEKKRVKARIRTSTFRQPRQFSPHMPQMS